MNFAGVFSLPNSLALAILALSASAIGSSPAEDTASRPNILLIVSEDNGPELGCYGDPYARTPALDGLAKNGVRFGNASVPYSVCSPSRACFLTGLYPQQNGHLGLATHKFALFQKFPNIFTHLKSAGYHTGLIGKLHVNPESAFEAHIDFRAIRGANFGRRNISEYAEEAAACFAAAKDAGKPFFLSVNYPDAHLPFLRQQFGSPADPIAAEKVKPLPWIGADSPRLRQFTADYYNCLARLDDGIALLLAELEKTGAAADTLIIYIGDHGAQFSRGKTSCYEAGLRIPMIVRWPGRSKPGTVRDELVSTIDILPTALSAAGITIPENLPGSPLQPLLGDPAETPWREFAVAFGSGGAPAIGNLKFSIRDTRYKLIWNPVTGPDYSAKKYLAASEGHFVTGTTAGEIAASSPEIQNAYARYLTPPTFELYDLLSDPHEFQNLAGHPHHAKVKERLLGALRDWQKTHRDPFRNPENIRRFAAEMQTVRERYPRLGYRRDKAFRWNYLDYLNPD